MSNRLTISRVRIQDINSRTGVLGEPRYAVEASDNYESKITMGRESLTQLEQEILEAGGILEYVKSQEGDGFAFADLNGVGFDNYVGPANDRQDGPD